MRQPWHVFMGDRKHLARTGAFTGSEGFSKRRDVDAQRRSFDSGLPCQGCNNIDVEYIKWIKSLIGKNIYKAKDLCILYRR
jgi:hypothetical protein